MTTTLDNLKPSVRLAIVNPESGSHSEFGRGVAALCLRVRNLGSLNAAAKDMGMAYSKAWRIIRETESSLDIALLNRDGAHGSALTEEGNKILDLYLTLDTALQQEAQQHFEQAMKN